MTTFAYRIVAADHPALDRDVARFVGTLVDGLNGDRDQDADAVGDFDRFRSPDERGACRLAAVECGLIIGLAQVAADGTLDVAVAPTFRGLGIGSALGRAALDRAHGLGHRQLSVDTSCAYAARRIAIGLECETVDRGAGRVELIPTSTPTPPPHGERGGSSGPVTGRRPTICRLR